MLRIGRNDPCPCGSGKKFKKCHLGREEELVLEKLEHLPEGAAEKIAALPEVDYADCQGLRSRLDLKKLTGANVGVKFVDLEAYLATGWAGRQAPADLSQSSAGQMINPIKTLQADPRNIYLALSPGVSQSTLLHQLAHYLDYLAGSKMNPGLARPLSLELEAPLELLEHPKEFGYWLDFLKNEFGVTLDAEDAIVDFLYEKGYLIPGQVLQSDQYSLIDAHIKRTLEFIQQHRSEIDQRIRDREGYLEDKY